MNVEISIGRRFRRWAALAVAAGCLVVPVGAYQNLRTELRRNGSSVLQAFESLREVLQQSSAVIYDGRDEIVYGTIVAADGLIVTKASEIAGRTALNIRVGERKFEQVEVLATDECWDLALLRIDADDLVPVAWSEAGEPEQGTWVATNGATSRSRRRALVGIVSANPRAVPQYGGAALGVVLDADASKLKITEVVEGSGAAKAELKVGDVIITLDGEAVDKREKLLKLMEGLKGGNTVRLGIVRDGEEQEVEVELMSRSELFGDPMSRNDAMSGRFSKRRSGFPRVLQHDILGARNSVGGPLLDLSGKCVGVNIARANRAETYAIPAKEMLEVLGELRAKAGGE